MNVVSTLTLAPRRPDYDGRATSTFSTNQRSANTELSYDKASRIISRAAAELCYDAANGETLRSGTTLAALGTVSSPRASRTCSGDSHPGLDTIAATGAAIFTAEPRLSGHADAGRVPLARPPGSLLHRDRRRHQGF
jgi:YD repeat-containing protein